MSIIEEMNLASNKQILEELDLLKRSKIPRDTTCFPLNIESIKNRELSKWCELKYNLPQNIFFIKYKNQTHVGRKLISDLHVSGKLKEINCSGINASMILGVLDFYEEDTNEILVYYFPYTFEEKLTLFTEIKIQSDLDIFYPFKYIDKITKLERTSPELGWSLNPMRASNLGIGEEHIRRYTINYLKGRNMDGKFVYDPACSTGEFLHTIKKEFPKCTTIGQDLSQQMIDYAKDFVDEVVCMDAMNSSIADETMDYIFIRFLNSEIVTSTAAQTLLLRIAGRCKNGGLIFVFGHTPVLVYRDFMKYLGLKILQSSAYDPERNILFQYYVLEKTTTIRNE